MQGTESDREPSSPSGLLPPASGDWWSWAHDVQDRIRDPSLTLILVLELAIILVAAPLTALGWPLAEAVLNTLIWLMVLIIVLLSRRRGAIVAIVLGIALTLGDLSPGGAWSPTPAGVLSRGGTILAFSALTWVVAHAVYAPGRITSHRLQGAVVVYLNLAMIFAAAYRVIWELSPTAFSNVPVASGLPGEFSLMLYFSLTTLTTTGSGDITPVHPFARSLANIESVVGQLYLAITVARLVTLELADRRR